MEKLQGPERLRPRNRSRMTCLLVVLLVAAGGARAHAQDRRREPKVIQLEEIRIEGRVQKPNAFYILNRSQLGYEVMDLRTSFLRKIVRSVQAEPF